MFQITFLLLILTQFAIGQAPKVPAAPVAPPPPQVVQVADPVLSAKVDSLTFALKEIRFEFKSISEINENLRDIVWQLALSLFGLFGLAVTALGYLLHRRSQEEKDYVADKVKEMVTPFFNTKIAKVQTQVTENEGELNTLSRNYHHFASQVETKQRAYEDLNLDSRINAATKQIDLNLMRWKLRLAYQLLHFSRHLYGIAPELSMELLRDFYTLSEDYKNDHPVTDGILNQAYTHLKKIIEEADPKAMNSTIRAQVEEIRRNLPPNQQKEILQLMTKHHDMGTPPTGNL